jgi:hypothetical protein
MTRQFSSISVNITEDIIEHSVQRDSSHCMIADAVRALVPDAKWVSVDLQTVRFTDTRDRKRYVYLTPRRAQEALIRFDQGEKSEPFRFFLRDPQVIPLREVNRGHQKRDAEKAEAAAVAKAATPKKKPAAKKAALKNTTHPSDRPRKEGGQPPPTAVLSNAKGRTREFGLRSLAR